MREILKAAMGLAVLATASPLWASGGFQFRDPANNADILGSMETASGNTNIKGSITASSGTFTASGNTQYSVKTSSGLSLGAGCIHFPDGSLQCTKPVGGGDAGLASTQTWTGTNTLKGPVVVSSDVLTGGVIRYSSFTYFSAGYQTPLGVFGVCTTTIEVTTPEISEYHIGYSGSIEFGGQPSNIKLGFLLDGLWITPFNSTFGSNGWYIANGAFPTPATTQIRATLAAGTHKVCITCKADGDENTFCRFGHNSDAGKKSIGLFYAERIALP